MKVVMEHNLPHFMERLPKWDENSASKWIEQSDLCQKQILLRANEITENTPDISANWDNDIQINQNVVQTLNLALTDEETPTDEEYTNQNDDNLQHVVIYMNLNAEPRRKFSFCLSFHEDKIQEVTILNYITNLFRNTIWVNWTHDETFGKPSGMCILLFCIYCST
jgi:hypothetical protein